MAWVLTLLQEAGVDVLVGDDTLRLVLAFLVGATMWLYADRLPMRSVLAALAALTLVAGVATLENYRVLGLVPAAYLLVWLGTCLPWSVSLDRDLSYGLYIYHWPVLPLVAATSLVALPMPLFILVGGAIAGVIALVSWHVVEQPALRQKNRDLPWRRASESAHGQEEAAATAVASSLQK